MTIQRLSHIGVCVSNLDSSVAFYRDGLGFREAGHLEVAGEAVDTLLELEGTQLSAVYLERDGVRIELLHYAVPGALGETTPRPMNALGLTHLSLRVEDLNHTLHTLRGLGANVMDATRTENPEFEAAAIFVTDPDGTRIELVQAPGDPNKLPGQ